MFSISIPNVSLSYFHLIELKLPSLPIANLFSRYRSLIEKNYSKFLIKLNESLEKTSPSSKSLPLRQVDSDSRTHNIFIQASKITTTQPVHTLSDPTHQDFLYEHSLYSQIGLFKKKVSWEDYLISHHLDLEKKECRLGLQNFCALAPSLIESDHPLLHHLLIHKGNSAKQITQEMKEISHNLDNLHFTLNETFRFRFEKILYPSVVSLQEKKEQLEDFSQQIHKEILNLKVDEFRWITIKTPTTNRVILQYAKQQLAPQLSTFFSQASFVEQLTDNCLHEIDAYLPRFNLSGFQLIPQNVRHFIQKLLYQGLEELIPQTIKPWIPELLIEFLPEIVSKGLKHTLAHKFPVSLDLNVMDAFVRVALSQGIEQAKNSVLIPHIYQKFEEQLAPLQNAPLDILYTSSSFVQDILDHFHLAPGIGNVWLCLTKKAENSYNLEFYSSHFPSQQRNLHYTKIPSEKLSKTFFYSLLRFEAETLWDPQISLSQTEFKEVFFDNFHPYLMTDAYQKIRPKKFSDIVFHRVFNHFSDKQQQHFCFAYSCYTTLSLCNGKNKRHLIRDISKASECLKKIKELQKQSIQYASSQIFSQEQFQVIWATLEESKQTLLTIHPDLNQKDPHNKQFCSQLPKIGKFLLNSLLALFDVSKEEIYLLYDVISSSFKEDELILVNTLLEECLDSLPKKKSKEANKPLIDFLSIRDLEDLSLFIQDKILANKKIIFYTACDTALKTLYGNSLSLTQISYSVLNALIIEYGDQTLSYFLSTQTYQTYLNIKNAIYHKLLTTFIRFLTYTFLDTQAIQSFWKEKQGLIVSKDSSKLSLEKFSQFLESSDTIQKPSESISSIENAQIHTLKITSHDDPINTIIPHYPENNTDLLMISNLLLKKTISLSEFHYALDVILNLEPPSKNQTCVWNSISEYQLTLKIISDCLFNIFLAKELVSVDNRLHSKVTLASHYCLAIIDYLCRKDEAAMMESLPFIPLNFISFIQSNSCYIDTKKEERVLKEICAYFNIDYLKIHKQNDFETLKKQTIFPYLFSYGSFCQKELIDFDLIAKTPEGAYYESLCQIPSISELVNNSWQFHERKQFLSTKNHLLLEENKQLISPASLEALHKLKTALPDYLTTKDKMSIFLKNKVKIGPNKTTPILPKNFLLFKCCVMTTTYQTRSSSSKIILPSKYLEEFSFKEFFKVIKNTFLDQAKKIVAKVTQFTISPHFGMPHDRPNLRPISVMDHFLSNAYQWQSIDSLFLIEQFDLSQTEFSPNPLNKYSSLQIRLKRMDKEAKYLNEIHLKQSDREYTLETVCHSHNEYIIKAIEFISLRQPELNLYYINPVLENVTQKLFLIEKTQLSYQNLPQLLSVFFEQIWKLNLEKNEESTYLFKDLIRYHAKSFKVLSESYPLFLNPENLLEKFSTTKNAYFLKSIASSCYDTLIELLEPPLEKEEEALFLYKLCFYSLEAHEKSPSSLAKLHYWHQEISNYLDKNPEIRQTLFENYFHKHYDISPSFLNIEGSGLTTDVYSTKTKIHLAHFNLSQSHDTVSPHDWIKIQNEFLFLQRYEDHLESKQLAHHSEKEIDCYLYENYYRLTKKINEDFDFFSEYFHSQILLQNISFDGSQMSLDIFFNQKNDIFFKIKDKKTKDILYLFTISFSFHYPKESQSYITHSFSCLYKNSRKLFLEVSTEYLQIQSLKMDTFSFFYRDSLIAPKITKEEFQLNYSFPQIKPLKQRFFSSKKTPQIHSWIVLKEHPDLFQSLTPLMSFVKPDDISFNARFQTLSLNCLEFQLKQDGNIVKAYSIDSFPGYFISSQQSHPQLPQNSTLTLENNFGHTKTLYAIKNAFHILSSGLSFLRPFTGVFFESWISKIIQKDELQIKQNLESIFFSDQQEYLIFDQDHNNLFTSEDSDTLAFLFTYHLIQQKTDLAQEYLKKMMLLGHTSQMNPKTIRWLLLAIPLVTVRKDPKMIDAILNAFSLYYENCLLYNQLPFSAFNHYINKELSLLTGLSLLFFIHSSQKPLEKLESSKKWILYRFAHYTFSYTCQKYLDEYQDVLGNTQKEALLKLFAYIPFSQDSLKEFLSLSKKYRSQQSSEIAWAVPLHFIYTQKNKKKSKLEEKLEDSYKKISESPTHIINKLNAVIEEQQKKDQVTFSFNSKITSIACQHIKKSSVFQQPQSVLHLWFSSHVNASDSIKNASDSIKGLHLNVKDSYPPTTTVTFSPKALDLHFFDYWRLVTNDIPEIYQNDLAIQQLFQEKRSEFQTFLDTFKGYYSPQGEFLLYLLKQAKRFPSQFTSIQKGIFLPFEKELQNQNPSFFQKINPLHHVYQLEKTSKRLFQSDFDILNEVIEEWMETNYKKTLLNHIKKEDLPGFLKQQIQPYNVLKKMVFSLKWTIPVVKTMLMKPMLVVKSLIKAKEVSQKVCGLIADYHSKTPPLRKDALCFQILDQPTQQHLDSFQRSLDNVLTRFIPDFFLFEETHSHSIPESTLLIEDSLDTHAKQSLQELSQSLNCYQNRLETLKGKYKLISKDSLKKLSHKISCERISTETFLKKSFKDILETIQNTIFAKKTLEEKASFFLEEKENTLSFSIEDILSIFIQSNSKKYQDEFHFSSLEEIKNFEIKIYQYLIAQTFLQKLQRISSQIQHIQSYPQNLSSLQWQQDINKLALALKEQRVFSFIGSDEQFLKANLMFEYSHNVLLWNLQYEQMAKVILSNSSNASIESITGSGKTSYMFKVLSHCVSSQNKIVINCYPEPLTSVHTRSLALDMQQTYHQTVMSKSIQRSTFNHISAIETFYADLVRSLENHDILSMTQSDMQSIELSFLSSLFSCFEKQSQRLTIPQKEQDKCIALSHILKILKEHAHFNLDEQQLLCNPRKEKNFPCGSKSYLDTHTINTVHKVMRICYTHPKVMAILNLHLNQQASLKEDDIKPLIRLIAQIFLNHEIESLYSHEESSECLSYILGELDYIPDFVETSSHKDSLGLVKGIFTKILPLSLKSISRVDCGPPKENAHRDEFAVVYDGNENPIPNTIIQNPIEALIKTYIMQASTPLTKEQCLRFLNCLQIKAKKESQKLKVDFSSTPTYHFFLKISGHHLLDQSFNKDHVKHFPSLFEIVKTHPEIKSLYVKLFPARQIFYYEKSIKSNAINFMSMSSSRTGFSATPYNKTCYYQNTDFFLVPETSGELVNLILKIDQKPGSICSIQSQRPEQILTECFNEFISKDPKYLAFIDTGALLRGMSNERAAQIIMKLCLQKRQDIQAVVYFNKEDKVMYLDTHLASHPIEECCIELKHRFTLYDDSHCVGADLKQDPQAIAIVTLGEKTRLQSKLFQGLGRMRGLFQDTEQSFTIIIPEFVQKLIGKTHIKAQDVITFCLKNEQEALLEDNFKSDCNKVIDTFRSEILDQIYHLLEKKKFPQALSLFGNFISLFVETSDLSFFNLYGKIDVWNGDPHIFLNNLKLYWMHQCEKEKLSQRSIKKISAHIALIGNNTPYPKTIHAYLNATTPSSSLGSYQEIEADECEEHNNEIEQDHDEEEDEALDQNLIQSQSLKSIDVSSKGLLDDPIPFFDHLSIEDLKEISISHMNQITQLPLVNRTLLFPQSPLGRPVFLLKEILENSEIECLNYLATTIDNNIFVCNSMVQKVGSYSLDIFSPVQRSWDYFIAIKNAPGIHPGFNFLLTDTEGMKFWRDKLHEESTSEVKIGIYSVALGGFLLSNFGSQSTNIQKRPSIIKMRALCLFFNGRVNYRLPILTENLDKPEYETTTQIKKWISEHSPELIEEVFDFIQASYRQKNKEGSHIDFIFDEVKTLLI